MRKRRYILKEIKEHSRSSNNIKKLFIEYIENIFEHTKNVKTFKGKTYFDTSLIKDYQIYILETIENEFDVSKL